MLFSRYLRKLPVFRVLAIAQVALLARRHLRGLSREDRRRLVSLVRRGRSLSPDERREVRDIVGRLEPREFAFAAADKVSPLPLPRRLLNIR
jgi:hypothetical protein